MCTKLPLSSQKVRLPLFASLYPSLQTTKHDFPLSKAAVQLPTFPFNGAFEASQVILLLLLLLLLLLAEPKFTPWMMMMMMM